MTGTTIAQAIPVAVAPILTRIYTPEDFGILALYLAVSSVLSTVSTGRYELAIMAPVSKSEAQGVVFLSMIFSLGVFVITTIIIWLFNSEIAALLGNQRIGKWLYFVPITVFSFGLYQSIDYWLNRERKYRKMAENKLVQAGSVSLIQVVVGLISNAGLIVGHVIGWIFSVITIIARNEFNFKCFNFNVIKNLAVKYKKYPLLQAPSSLLDGLSVQAPIFFMSKYFDATVVGFLGLVLKMLSAPTALISRSTGQVFFQRVSEHAKVSPELLMSDVYRVALKLSVISIVIFSPILFFGPEIFSILFGKEWMQAGNYAQILVFAIAIKFVVSPISTVFLAIDKITTSSVWQLSYFLITFSVLFVAIHFDIKTFLWIYVANEIVMYIFYFILINFSVKSFIRSSGE